MGLTKWLLNKGLFYMFIFGIFYIVGEMLGWTPKVLRDIVSWIANNFLLISILLMFTMGFWILLKLIGKPRSGQT